MLTYLMNVTGDILAVSIVLGVIFAYTDQKSKDAGKLIIRIGLFVGFVISIIRAYITNTKRLVNGWKVGARGYEASLIIFVLLIVTVIVFSIIAYTRKRSGKNELSVGFNVIIPVVLALLTASYMYGTFPNVYVYPFKFDTGGNGILSTDYLFRFGGYLLGILVSFLSAVAAYKICMVVENKGYGKMVSCAFYLLNTTFIVRIFAKLMLVLTPRKIIDSIKLFEFGANSNNHDSWYTYIGFIVLVVMCVVVWVGSFVKKEAYSTNAEHRKQRAIWRSGRRYSVVVLVCFVCAILCATWFVELNKVQIREAPVEDPEIIKDEAGEDVTLRVSLELVSDGHLHRFGYTTEDGNPVRFIVVLKQEGTTNYGIGLDACEICGEAGYYENGDGQVVCKKCQVVMNRFTIGMKGGCNPIIIDYDMDENYITVPVSELVDNESRFKK